jgi:hypothetical protein
MRTVPILFAMVLASIANAQIITPIPTLEACMHTILACMSGCKNDSICLVACKAGLERCVNSVPKDSNEPLRDRVPK